MRGPAGAPGGGDRSYDVGINKKPAGPVQAGQSATFGLSAYNVGPSPVDSSTGVTVTDTLPSNFVPPVTFTAGAGWSCSVSGLTLTCHWIGGAVGLGQAFTPITVTATAKGVGGYTNCTDVTIKPADVNPRNNRSCVDDVVTPPKGGGDIYDVGVEKKGPASIQAGQSATFSLAAYNVGPATVTAATGVTVTDTLPSNFVPPLSYTAPAGWTCNTAGLTLTCHWTGGSIGVGQAFPLITVTALAKGTGDYKNCADVALKPADANPRNNEYCIPGVVTPPVKQGYDVGIDKKGPGSTQSGQTATFGLFPRNNGPSPVNASTGVIVTDTLPSNFIPPLSYTAPAGWTCNTSGLTLNCQWTGGTIPVGPFPQITVTATASEPGDYKNCADIRMKPDDLNPRDNESCVPGIVVKPGKPTQICVFKFNDLNGNGVQDNGEPALSGWQFTIRNGQGVAVDAGQTDAKGQFCTTGRDRPLTAGAYTATETLQPGWMSTNPGGTTPTKSVTAIAGQSVQVQFGNMQRGKPTEICVSKFNDLNGNGVQDNGELPLAGWQFAIRNSAGMLVGSGQTDANGKLCTASDAGLSAGNYTATETLQPGWISTNPGGATPTKTVTAVAGQSVQAQFGNQQRIPPKPTQVCVLKYNDLNGNGMLDGGEPPLSGWQFTIRNSANVNEGQGLTNANGVFCTAPDELLAPGPYTATETLQPGWISTNPGGATPTKTVTAISGQSVTAQFGNKAQGSNLPSFSIEKVVDQDCAGGPPFTLCKFTVRIFNNGPGTYTGPLTFTDLITSFNTPTGGVTLVPPYPPGWTCTGIQPMTCTIPSVTILQGGYVAIPLNMNVNGAVPPDKNCATLTAPATTPPACVPIGHVRFDLVIDSNFVNTPGMAGSHDLNYYTSSMPGLVPGAQVILTGSLTSTGGVTFAPWAPTGPWWNCSGTWAGFVCTMTVPTNYTGNGLPILTMRTSYPGTSSGQPFTYVGTVTVNGNIDPNVPNSTRTAGGNLP